MPKSGNRVESSDAKSHFTLDKNWDDACTFLENAFKNHRKNAVLLLKCLESKAAN